MLGIRKRKLTISWYFSFQKVLIAEYFSYSNIPFIQERLGEIRWHQNELNCLFFFLSINHSMVIQLNSFVERSSANIQKINLEKKKNNNSLSAQNLRKIFEKCSFLNLNMYKQACIFFSNQHTINQCT